MINLFGAKKNVPAQSTLNTSDIQHKVASYKQLIADLSKKKERNGLDAKNLFEEAKNCRAAGNDIGALQAMKRYKAKQESVNNQQAQIYRFEELVDAIDNAATNRQVATALASVKTTLTMQNVDAESVVELNEEIQEQLEMTNEVSNALAEGGKVSEQDASELMAELDGLIARSDSDPIAAATHSHTASNVSLPSIPNTVLRVAKQAEAAEDDDEIFARQLAGGMR